MYGWTDRHDAGNCILDLKTVQALQKMHDNQHFVWEFYKLQEDIQHYALCNSHYDDKWMINTFFFNIWAKLQCICSDATVLPFWNILLQNRASWNTQSVIVIIIIISFIILLVMQVVRICRGTVEDDSNFFGTNSFCVTQVLRCNLSRYLASLGREEVTFSGPDSLCGL